jgi:Calcineurin-like phosphoesterase
MDDGTESRVILIIHISDIHFETDPLLLRAKMLSAAVSALTIEDPSHIVFIASGDIAYHGKSEEYDIALEFFLALNDDIKKRTQIPTIYLAVPGNHDCDFETEAKIRMILVPHARASDVEAETVINALLQAQRSYLQFEQDLESISDRPLVVKSSQELSKVLVVEDLADVEFLLINSSWMSTLHEQQGLRIPLSKIAATTQSRVVSVMHHPSNWLEPNNGRALRSLLEANSTLILTGHEHLPLASTVRNDRNEEFLHFEGNVFNSGKASDSGFYALLFETNGRGLKRYRFELDGDMYRHDEPRGWEPLPLNAKRQTKRFNFSEAHEKFLNDIAMPIRHGTVGEVGLRDIFVWPDLEVVSYDSTERVAEFRRKSILGKDLPHHLLLPGTILISGEEKAGKTALAKMLILEAKTNGIIPVYLTGHKSMRDRVSLVAALQAALTTQYTDEAIQRFEQLDLGGKLIIVDDVHSISSRYKTFADDLSRLAARVVLLAGDAALEVLLAGSFALTLTHYKIKPFGHLNRNVLVENWLTLKTVEDPPALARRLHQNIKRIDDLLGRGYVPAYPIFVITMLSVSESSLPLDTRASTFAYYYEVLIKTELLASRTSYTDMYIGFLSFLAYDMNYQHRDSISLSEFWAISERYKTAKDLRFDTQRMLDQLVSRRMLSSFNDNIAFRYDFVKLYFVAHYISANSHKKDIREFVSKLSHELSTQSNADILLFVAHVSSDPFVIDCLKEALDNTLGSSRPIDIQRDIPVIDYSQIADIAYTEQPALQGRRTHSQELDVAEANLAAAKEEALASSAAVVHLDENAMYQGEKAEQDDAMFLLLNSITAAFRNIEILGQIIKNYPGQLDAEIKFDIAKRAIDAGLRTLRMILDFMYENRQPIADDLIAWYRQKSPKFDQESAREIVERTMGGLTYLACFGTVKRVALAIGSHELDPTYERIVTENDTTAVKLIHAGILLDCAPVTPENTIVRYQKAISKQPLAETILRQLVLEHFYLFEVDRQTKQRICRMLGIKYREALGLKPLIN